MCIIRKTNSHFSASQAIVWFCIDDLYLAIVFYNQRSVTVIFSEPILDYLVFLNVR